MDIKAIKEKYDNNVPLKDIAKKHHITLKKLNSIIKTQDWHRKRRGGTKGNKGGRGVKGNKGNKNARPPLDNQNAVVTGYYSKFRNLFSEEEQSILDLNNTPSELEQIQHEIDTCDMLEYRYLKKVNELKAKQKDLTIVSMNKYGTQVSTEAKRTDELIDKFNKSLIMVQNERRKAIELKFKIKQGNKENSNGNNINININNDSNSNGTTDILESINKQLWGDEDVRNTE